MYFLYFSSPEVNSIALRGMYVLLEERQSWREEWRCAIIRHGGLLVAATPGTTGMQWLCADSCTTHQTVSTLTMNILAKQCSSKIVKLASI